MDKSPGENPAPHSMPPVDGQEMPSAGSSSAHRRLLDTYPWIVYVLPLGVFMALGSLEPTPATQPDAWHFGYSAYPWLYGLKIALSTAVLAWVWPALPKVGRISPLAVVVGIVGIVLWVGLWKLQLERRLLGPLGLEKLLGLGTRSAFNPFAELADRPAAAWGFLAVRLWGLVCVVPLAEELFLRGFLMRFLVRADWWKVPFGEANRAALLAATLVPMLMHPAELFAAAAWFSLVTWLLLKTRSLWDCVVAHATTNLLLGIYVLATGNWELM